MLARWRRTNISDSALDQTHSSITSFVERKIHPDINSLAEELASISLQHGPDLRDRAFQAEKPEPDIAGFVGLKPSTTRRIQREGNIKARTSPTPNEYQDREAENVHIGAYNDIPGEDQKELLGESIPDIETPRPPYEALLVDDIAAQMVAQPIIRRSTFGRRSGRQHFDVDVGARSASSSSSSLSQSLVTCPSAFPSLDQPDTPGSQPRSLYTSTPRSRSSSSGNFFRGSGIPSPHTFGMSTPPLQSNTKENDTYFTFKESPPPLPPLDHPAFRNVPNAKGVPSSRNEFPQTMQTMGVDEHGRFTRHTHSLPSLKRSKSATRIGSIKGSPKSTRPRSKSTVETGASVNTIDRLLFEATRKSPKSRTHSRNQSKSSLASSRRSSADYSAKQVSLIGDERVQDGCWEVQVSKEMIRLALEDVQGVEVRKVGKTRDAQASALGRARCKNRWTGAASRLGSPFFLQGPGTTHSSNLTDPRGSNDTAARFKPNSSSSSPRAAPEKSLRHEDMSHGGSTNPRTASTSSQVTNRGRESSEGTSSQPSGSISRRGGARATSAPSSKPPRLDTPNFSSIHDQGLSTLLVPPSLSVTSPTPEASPSSPSRRTHVKSSPTTPTTSVLRTPSKPPVIEKSYSSGSGKRKADEAGVGGDKTPPKDQKEPRATFAPDPRTHRASAASSSGHAPSSYNRSKRVRLTDTSEGGRSASSRSGSRAGTLPPSDESPYNAKTTGSWSSRGSFAPATAPSYGHGGPPVAPSASHASHYSNTTAQQQSQAGPSGRPPSRRSLSQASIPISALISPHAPSVTRTGGFHMRDPRKPPPIQSTPWTLSLPSHVQEGESRWAFRGWVERGGSPLHAWLFFIGFILFPVWWAAALFIPIPKTRRLGGTDAEKAVMLDDPQVEHDAKSWRTRCRVMAVVSLITYIPFIVLVAIFA